MKRSRITAATLAVAAASSLALAGCSGAGGIDVAGEDYRFSGMPDKLVAGDHAFKFRNKGNEEHEMVLMRLKPGAPALEQLLDMPQEEAEKFVDILGFSMAAPGAKGDKIEATLEKGNYALVCFLPVGGTGAPHFTAGMLRPFTVT